MHGVDFDVDTFALLESFSNLALVPLSSCCLLISFKQIDLDGVQNLKLTATGRGEGLLKKLGVDGVEEFSMSPVQ